MSEETYLIAVDGGGTGCRAAVGTATRGILAEARGGPANVSTDFNRSIINIVAAVSEALTKAAIPEVALTEVVAHLGLAGANSRGDMASVEAALPYGHCTVTGDRDTAVAGALGPQDGFVVALGTGTIVARQRNGVVATVGGWGFTLSDEASGAWLGKGLLTHILLAEDGIRTHSPLSRSVLQKHGGRDAIVTFAVGARPADYATLAPDIIGAAKAGDVLARALMAEGSEYIEQALAALGFATGDVLCLSGGVGPSYAAHLPPALTGNLQPARGSALDGAFALAQRAATGR